MWDFAEGSLHFGFGLAIVVAFACTFLEGLRGGGNLTGCGLLFFFFLVASRCLLLTTRQVTGLLGLFDLGTERSRSVDGFLVNLRGSDDF